MRIWFLMLGLLAMIVMLVPGCSGISEESYGSAWTALPASVGETDTDIATPTDELKITVLPAQATVQNVLC